MLRMFEGVFDSKRWLLTAYRFGSISWKHTMLWVSEAFLHAWRHFGTVYTFLIRVKVWSRWCLGAWLCFIYSRRRPSSFEFAVRFHLNLFIYLQYCFRLLWIHSSSIWCLRHQHQGPFAWQIKCSHCVTMLTMVIVLSWLSLFAPAVCWIASIETLEGITTGVAFNNNWIDCISVITGLELRRLATTSYLVGDIAVST